MHTSFTLWYWLRGSPLYEVHYIDVPPDITFAALIERLCESLKLDTPWINICLYKVPEAHPLSLVGEYENALGQLSISALGRPLRAAHKLWKVFVPQPQENHLHLILDASPLKVSCRIRGGDPADQFIVKIPRGEDLFTLKVKAKEFYPQISYVVGLRLYKISFKNDDELKEILGRRGEGELIRTEQHPELDTVIGDMRFSSEMLEVVIDIKEY